jgi:four helix bundle protein
MIGRCWLADDRGNFFRNLMQVFLLTFLIKFMSNYKTLDVWKVSMQLVKEVYILAKKFPKDEVFGLTSQTKRAAVSVPANIAEGIGRQYKKDTIQFLYISRGSVYELETHLNIAVMVEIITEMILIELCLLLKKHYRY